MTLLKYTTLLFFPLMFLGSYALAQQGDSQIHGSVFGPGNEPVMYSTIMLLNKDSVLVKGTLSSEEGLFVLEKIAAGDYFVQIRNLEYKTFITNKLSLKTNEKLTLERITLIPALTQLDAVEVTATKALVEVHADKMVFNVSSSINASGNSGLELIGKSPGVIVDMDNNIILQGKSGVLVFVNGRPSRLSGSDLTNFLESMRSENIESIEIITNPSSKYDAEGTAGIINIVLKKNVNLGFNGNLTGSYVQGRYSRVNAGTSLSYSGEKINVFTNLNYTDNNWQDNFTEIALQNGFLLDKKSRGLNNRKGYNFSGGMDYTINARQTFSLDGRVFINNRDNVLRSTTGIFDGSNSVNDEILRAAALDKNPSENYNLNLNYRLAVSSTSNLSADVSLGKFSSNKNTQQPNDYLDPTTDVVLMSFDKEYDQNTEIDLWSAMLDYELKFKTVTLSAGAKYSYIKTGNELAFYNLENGQPIFDISRSNDFTYTEKVAALYLMMNARPSDKVTINAGLRMENTSSLGVLESGIPTEDSEVERNYLDFFPNVGISFDNKNNSVISASYGKRITRPNYQDLNPFESRMSELSSWKGNPFLNPNYITNYQLTYAYKRKLVISNTYSVTSDFFATIFEIREEKGSVLIPRNLQKATNNGLSVSYPLTVSKWWEFSSFLVYNIATYKGELEGTQIDLKSNQYSFRLQNNLKLPGGIAMELTSNIWGPWIWRGSVEVEGSYSVNIGIRKDFFERKLLIQLTGNDIFRSASDYFYKSNYGGMEVDGVRMFDNQRAGINITYNFGNQQAKARKRSRSAIDDELNRISD
jgi:iron complex outermembrane recepter protein